MYDRLGALVSRRWLWVLLGWVGVALAAQFLAPRWDNVTRDGDFAYLPEGMTSVRGERLLEDGLSRGPLQEQIIVVVARGDGPLRARGLRRGRRLGRARVHSRGEIPAARSSAC